MEKVIIIIIKKMTFANFLISETLAHKCDIYILPHKLAH